MWQAVMTSRYCRSVTLTCGATNKRRHQSLAEGRQAPQGKAVPLSPPHPQVVLCHPLGRGPEQLQVLRAQDVPTATRACPNIHAHTKEMTNSAQSTYMSSL